MDLLTLGIVAGAIYLFTRSKESASPVVGGNPGPRSVITPELPMVLPVPQVDYLLPDSSKVTYLPESGGGQAPIIAVEDPNQPGHYTTWIEPYRYQDVQNLQTQGYTPWDIITEKLASIYGHDVMLHWFTQNKTMLTTWDASSFLPYGGREAYWNKMVEAMQGVLMPDEIGTRPF
jgi:hypothetical protein